MAIQFGRYSRHFLVVALCFSFSCATESRTPLRVATSGDYPPFSVDGAGLDVEIAGLLAASLDRELELRPFRWPTLQQTVRSGDVDIAMGGITWRPDRAVDGWMSRAIAVAGPCVVGAVQPHRVAVNRGGILERWTRTRFEDDQIVTTEDNRSLPDLLARGDVDAFVTDSLEVQHFAGGTDYRCDPPTDRKVYWVAPDRAAELGPVVDGWLRDHASVLDAQRQRHLGAGTRSWSELDHLVDLLARRLELMPWVAAWKQQHGLAIEDLAQEQRVLDRVGSDAEESGLAPDPVARLFRVQMDLAKTVQRRHARPEPTITLDALRATLGSISRRVLEALVELRSSPPQAPLELDASQRAWLATTLEAEEIELLRQTLEELFASFALSPHG